MRIVSSRPSTQSQSAERLLARIAWIPGSATRTRQRPVPKPEALFEELDGHVLHVPHRRWQIRVYSIWEERGWRWVQLALEGEHDCMVTMRTALHDGAEELLRTLSAWMQNPAKVPDGFLVA